jgi:DNA-binding phage protein
MRAASIASDIKVEIVEIGHEMNQAGLPKEFIASAVSTAFEFEGVYDLLKMWVNEDDSAERDEIIADVQELIEDCSQAGQIEGVYVRFDDLDAIAKNIRGFKDHLRSIVDQNGGIKNLSTLTGIPQPSLSRFFNSATMPRRSTLHKIARALKLSQIQIATEWSR